MRPYLTLFVLLTLSFSSFAGEIRTGATMEVKANSIWFYDADKLAHWQKLKKNGNSTALASYQDEVLSSRDAFQFINELTVRILSYEPRENRVNVKGVTPGRFLGGDWWLDADALVQ
jgi:hypothetical protein